MPCELREPLEWRRPSRSGYIPALHAGFLRPRPWRWLRRLAHQITVHDALADDAMKSVDESSSILRFAGVEAIRLFIQIPKQMEWFHADIGALDCPLQEAPEVFETVGVHLPLDIRFGMVNDFVDVIGLKPGVRRQIIGEDFGSRSDVSVDMGEQRLSVDTRNGVEFHDAMPVRSVTFQQAHDRRFPDHAGASLDLPCALALVHEACVPTDEGFVHFDFTGQFPEGFGLHRQSDTVRHEPCSLLGDAEGAGNLVGTDAVFAIDHHPQRREPLVQADRAVLEDGAHLDGELLLAGFALPQMAGFQERMLHASADRADGTFGPPERRNEVQADVRIGEVSNGLDQGSWSVHVGFHASRVPHEAG